jgi:hypothetical protein
MCWLHDPARADQRHRHASRAARSKGNREVAGLKDEIKAVISEVKAGDLDRNDAAVMIQGYRALKDFIALERQVRETDELATEIEELKREYGVAETGGRRPQGPRSVRARPHTEGPAGVRPLVRNRS